MKLSKKLETEVLKAYNVIWDAYLQGDMGTFASILDARCYIIGSAVGEVFGDKKSAVTYYSATAAQIAGKAEFRNRKINLMPVDQGIIINEQSDFYFLIDNQWTFYGPARISSLYHKKGNKWKVIHQHGSLPDSRTGEGEQVNTDKIKAENLQLRDAVKRRTVELENKNRELEIESSLERVRARTMAMQSSNDLLQVIDVLKDQLQQLGFELDAVNFITDLDQNGYQMWLATPGGTILQKVYIPRIEYRGTRMLEEAVRNRSEMVSYVLTKDEKDTYFRNFFENTALKEIPEAFRRQVFDQPGMAISLFILNSIVLTVANFKAIPLTEEQNNTIRRFASVFEQSYIRFLDLEKAEAQTREAKIEAALERVRARTMAMQRSEDLLEAASLLFKQIEDLGTKSWSSGFIIFQPEDISMNSWMSKPDGSIGVPFNIPLTEDSFFIKINAAFQRGEEFFVMESGGKELEETYRYMFSLPGAGKALGAIENLGFQMPTFQITHCVFFLQGFLMFITYEPCPEMWDIFKRFGKVFEQTYTRFLDLQKAEAQAREAQIELSLERVRTRTMIMQKSEELVETSVVLFQELRTLGVKAIRTGVSIIDNEKELMELWSSQLIEQKQNKVLGIVPMHAHPFFEGLLNAWRRNDSDFIYEFEGEKVKAFYQAMSSIISYPAQENYNPREVFSPFFFPEGSLTVVSHNILTDEERNIMLRFARVFGLLYRRFHDLQKSEAQAREAQIEAALEKVRSRTMAMQKSEELPEAANVLFLQVQSLGIPAWSCGYNILAADKKSSTCIMSSEGEIQVPFVLPLTEHWSLLPWYEAIQNNLDFFVYGQGGEDLVEHYRYLATVPGLEKVFQQFDNAGISLPANQINHLVQFTNGFLLFITYEPVPHAHDIFKRFGKVFEQTYTRFNDLELAEAQARESQIQLALERVRARTMAMQKSDELAEAAQLLYEEFGTLNIKTFLCGYCFYKEEQDKQTIWVTLPDGTIVPDFVDFPITGDDVLDKRYQDWKQRKPLHVLELQGEKNKEHHRFLSSKVSDQTANEIFAQIPDRIIFYCANFSTGYLFIIATEFLTEDEENVIIRFGKVFEQTYTRFLDLQKAEAQAREAKIEAALERTRTQSMIMQHSNELDDSLRVFHQQVLLLGIDSAFSYLWLPDEEKDRHIFWAAWAENNSTIFRSKAINYPLDRNEPATAQCLIDWKSNEPVYSYRVPPAAVENYFATWSELIGGVEHLKTECFKGGLYYVEAFMKYGCFGVIVKNGLKEDEKKILARFAIEFERTYTRFLDLQKAEAQSREAKIEASLERVRAGTMAMYKSEDLSKVAEVVFKELDTLELGILRCGIGIINKENRNADAWITSVSEEGKTVQVSGNESMDQHPLLQGAFDAWLNHTDFSYVLEGEDLVQYYKTSGVGKVRLPDSQLILSEDEITTQYYQISVFEGGGLFAFRANAFPEEAKMVMKRFAAVFNQSYTRFLDLQNAEAQAREAKVEASLERVRSKALAMHSSEDLAATLEAFYYELRSLGATPRRCGVALINKETKLAELKTMNTTEEGDIIAVSGVLKMVGHPVLEEIYRHWLMQKEYHVVLRGQEINNYYKVVRPQISYPNYPHDAVQYGYYFMFPEGDVTAWMDKELEEDELNIYRRFTSVLSLTYKRYMDLQQAEALAKQAEEDLVKLKSEKKRTEDALTELRNTQSQLIQTEKMASLGELTAGIAHEIQNPLNFVNNFSEVSNELLDEMLEEVARGNYDEVKSIVDDVKQNLEKIHHHGKRADGIVKGMLQHSRNSSGEKVLTDLNALADEYLRLAFHGLRAKDKSFNAAFKTDFDNSIGKIEIIPQDFGRVLVNLINNAFYAVNEKRNKGGNGYEPVVTISTKRAGDRVELRVIDNGNGIPRQALDKIFQPFFTTKPTGQGTGLGLSLSYDIVKAHGGELKVQTKEGIGSEFIIQLPV